MSSFETLLPAPNHQVKITLKFNLASFFIKILESPDYETLLRDVDRALPRVIDNQGNRSQPPTEPLLKTQSLIDLLKRDALAEQQQEILEKNRKELLALQEDGVPEQSKRDDFYQGVLPEKLPDGFLFAVLSQVGLSSLNQDLLFAELNLWLTLLDLSSFQMKPFLEENQDFMPTGLESSAFSYFNQEVFKLTVKTKGKGFCRPDNPAVSYLGYSTRDILLSSEGQLIGDQEIETTIEFPFPSGPVYDELISIVLDPRFYASPSFKRFGELRVSVELDEQLSDVQAQMNLEDWETCMNEFGSKLEIQALRNLETIVSNSKRIESDEEKLNPPEFMRNLTGVLNQKPSKETELLLEAYRRRSSDPRDWLSDPALARHMQCLDIYLLIFDQEVSSLKRLHEKRMKFKEKFVQKYRAASESERVNLQLHFHQLLADPASALHHLMTDEVSFLSNYAVANRPLAHTAVEIDRFFDNHNSAEEKSSVPQYPRTALTFGEVVQEQAPILQREALLTSKKIAGLGSAIGLVVGGSLLGGAIGAAAALVVVLILFAVMSYLHQKKEQRRQQNSLPEALPTPA